MKEGRPCGGCERGAPYGGAFDPAAQCHICFLYHTEPEWHALYGGDAASWSPPPARAAGDDVVQCKHRGKEVSREVCGPCGGRVQIKVFECKVHGQCTAAKRLPGKACCQGCPQGPVVVVANADGIGDALMGLCAVAGLKGGNPGRTVIFRVRHGWQREWVELFGGYDRLVDHDVATVTGVERRLNGTAAEDSDSRYLTPRWEHYANAIGAPCAAVPPPKPLPKDALAWAGRFKGKVALCPFSVWMDRAWDSDYWHRLEDMLYEAGHETVILDGLTTDGPRRASEYQYRGEVVCGEPAVRVAALLKSVRLVVANDSGNAHMAGMLKVPCLVLSWFHPAQRIHGIYGTVKSIHADHVKKGGWKRDITPDMVYAKAREMMGLPPPAPPPCDRARVARLDSRDLPPGEADRRFNAGLVRWRGRLLLAYRGSWERAHVHMAELGDDFSVRDSWTLPLEHPAAADGQEDPRLFVHAGKLHVSFSGVGLGAVHMLYARLSDDARSAEAVHRPHYDGRQFWEKNWAFFSHAGGLHAVYSVSPHVVLSIDGGRAWEAGASDNRLPWSGGLLRGGAPPVRVGDEYWHWFHGAKGDGDGRVYNVGLYAFEASPPFRVTRQTPAPVLHGDPATRPPGQNTAVVFPCGAVFEGGHWLVSMGVHDKWVEIHRFGAEGVAASLPPARPPAPCGCAD